MAKGGYFSTTNMAPPIPRVVVLKVQWALTASFPMPGALAELLQVRGPDIYDKLQ